MLKRLIFSFGFLLTCLVCRAEWSDNFLYSYYGKSEGLCDEYVLSTYRDSEGYLWVCTSNGLDRFDGYRFLHFSSDSDNPFTKTDDDFIHNVVEDRWGRLWLSSNSGVQFIDKKGNHLVGLGEAGFSSDEFFKRVSYVALGNDDVIYALRERDIMKVEIAPDGEISDVSIIETGQTSSRCMTLFQNMIVVGGFSGLTFVSPENASESGVPEIMMHLADITDVLSLLANGDYLWIGTEKGLYCYNCSDKKLNLFTHSDRDPNSISDNRITCMSLNNSGDLIIGTTAGVDLHSRAGGFFHMRQEHKYRSLNTNYINHVYVDSEGTMWVSTLVGGVNKVTPKNVLFSDMLVVDNGTSNIISCVYEDEGGNVFAGILGKGVAIKTARSSDFRIYSLKKMAGLSQDDIFSVEQDKRGDYWLSTRYDGLIRLPKERLDAPVFYNYNKSNSGILSNQILDMVYDVESDLIWFSSIDGMYAFDAGKYSCEKIDLHIDDQDNLWFYNLELTNDRMLLAGGYGFCEIDISAPKPDGGYNVRYQPRLVSSGGGDSEIISSIATSSDGVIYVGSHNGRLYRKTPQGTFEAISFEEGFDLSNILKLISDEVGNVWIGSSDGVFRYNAASGKMSHFGKGYGMSSTNCYINSGCRMRGKKTAFGTSNGLVIFESGIGISAQKNRTAKVVGVSVGGEFNPWSDTKTIHVYPSSPSFTVLLSTLDLSSLERVSYSYKLGNVNSDWNYSMDGSIPFNSVKPGRYNLTVRCTADGGGWSLPQDVVEIEVHPEFTQTFVFWLLVFCALFGLLCVFIISKMREREKARKHLELQVEEKTADLKTAIDHLLESKKSIEHQNIILEEQKAKLEEYAVYVEKSNKEKLMLYTNLTHEFKTPLSLILGPVSELKSKMDNDEEKSLLDIAERNSRYLLELVNQILDLRKVDSGRVVVKKECMDIIAFVDVMYHDYLHLFEQRGVEFERNFRLVNGAIISDKDIIFKILSNLLSNAMKFTPDGGKVIMNIAQFKSPGNKGFQYISLTNTGSFIAKDEIERVFDCYYKSENVVSYGNGSTGNTGIGLYLVRNLVLALGGHVSLRSTKESGTSFRMMFPVDFVQETHAQKVEDMDFDEEKRGSMPLLLLAEDNEDMRKYIKSILCSKYSVIEAANGEIAYELSCKYFPDLIISDMMMPVCDGLQFCRLIRGDDNLCHIPFLMLTALSDDDSRLKSYKEGVNAFLVKPFKKEMLEVRIDNILAEKKAIQEELSYDLENSYVKVNIDRSDKAFMEHLLEVLRNNYADPEFNVPKLLESMYMSMTPFYKKVTSLTGLTPALLIRRYRLQTAKSLMEKNAESGVSVSEIAYMVGFSDPKYFSKCFQKEYHLKPSSMLQKQDENKDLDYI